MTYTSKLFLESVDSGEYVAKGIEPNSVRKITDPSEIIGYSVYDRGPNQWGTVCTNPTDKDIPADYWSKRG